MSLTSIIVYVVSHDDESDAIARTDFPFPWARYIRIPNNQYFESNAFPIILSLYSEWHNKKFVGLVQHTFFRKAMSGSNIQNIEDNVDNYLQYDLIAMSGRSYRDPNWYHSNILQVMELLLTNLGMQEWYSRHSQIAQFYNNAFVCRPNLLLEYCHFVAQAMAVVETNSSLKARFDTDACYIKKTAPLLVQQACGKEYYDWRSFSFERLPCFWFASKRARIHFLNFPSVKPNSNLVFEERTSRKKNQHARSRRRHVRRRSQHARRRRARSSRTRTRTRTRTGTETGTGKSVRFRNSRRAGAAGGRSPAWLRLFRLRRVSRNRFF